MHSEIQLTSDDQGHTIHNTQVFSPDDRWIVFDARNVDTGIGSTATIAMVNVQTKEIKTLYHIEGQTVFGPGVGAATFSPIEDRVIFIHGIRNADKSKPYSVTRRTGVSIDVGKPFLPIFMDARDIIPPYTPGALRGGTHAHSWSGDGKWISFTYNDYVLEQLAKKDTSIADLRTVGVMVPRKVVVDDQGAPENNSGENFAVVVAEVTKHPRAGSDEIDKAFDEGWIGENGYMRADGTRQEKAIAFQGNVRNDQGKSITEVFVIDLPKDLTKAKIRRPLEGTTTTRPNVPDGVVQRRITYTVNGIVGPRHWLRTTPDGSVIAFLSKDEAGIIQIFSASPNGGEVKQLTHHSFPIQGPFNFSPDGKYIAYPADNSIFISNLKKEDFIRLTEKETDENKPVGAPVWSNKGDMIAYNKYVKGNKEDFLQLFVIQSLPL